MWNVESGNLTWFPHKHWGKRRLKSTLSFCGFVLILWKTYMCITDIARQKNFLEPKDVVKNWMRQKDTLEYLGLWEKLYNPNFKVVEFDHFRKPIEFEGVNSTRLPFSRCKCWRGIAVGIC